MKLFLAVFGVVISQVICLSIPTNIPDASITSGTLNDSKAVNDLTSSLVNSHYKSFSGQITDLDLQLEDDGGDSSNPKQKIVRKCIASKKLVETLSNEINEQIKNCGAVVNAEFMNVVTSSYDNAQMFMTFPSVIWNDIQTCGLDNSCRWQIVNDAIQETGLIPTKVFSLTARFQSLIFNTINSIDGCAINGLKVIAQTGVNLAKEVFDCIFDETTSLSCTPN